MRPLHKLKILPKEGCAGLRPDSRRSDQRLPDSPPMLPACVREEG